MDPSHITEFASPRYFDKLRSLAEAAENAAHNDGTATTTASQPATFTLPLGNPRPQPARRRRSDDTARSGDAKKRSLGHDLSSLRTQRRPSFALSIASFRNKVSLHHKSPSATVEHDEFIFAEEPAQENLGLHDLFFGLPNELQVQIASLLPVPTLLNLRLSCRAFHGLISLNESTIARHHLTNSVPRYALQLYPLSDPKESTLHYLCSLWHRLHVASKLAKLIAEFTTKEIFLRDSESKYNEFQPQHNRMRRRLMPLLFTMFHFFERYRELHVKHLLSGGTPLRLQPYTLNPIERQVMSTYSDKTLLHLHQIFPLVLSSYSRRLRPPSYAGRLERSIKGYLKDKPADEVYTTILLVGGLRQAESFWHTKGYNARRAAVDTWYGFVTTNPADIVTKSKLSKITGFGRKKVPAIVETATNEGAAGHDVASCNEWFCVKPTCANAWRHRIVEGSVFHTSLAAGPPMSPLPLEHQRLLLADQQHLTDIWLPTAEAIIMERGIVDSPTKIKRNTQVLLELIKEDGSYIDEEWAPGLSQGRRSDLQQFLSQDMDGVQDD